MKKFSSHTGLVAPLYRANIDTDQIIPKQFLTSIERTGFGKSLFYDWRFDEKDAPLTNFVLNQPRYAGASILLAGANFGCGSSREHAPWALLDFGFRVILAPSFADIFYHNSLKNGLLPVCLPETNITEFARCAAEKENYWLTIDLKDCKVRTPTDYQTSFEISDFDHRRLLEGFDEIDLTLRHEAAILAYEANHCADEIYASKLM